MSTDEDAATSDSSAKDWEEIARAKIATGMDSFFEQKVSQHAHHVAHAIREGEDAAAEFWTMVGRFNEFVQCASEDIVTTGGFSNSDPRVKLHSTGHHVQETFLRLGKAIEEDSVGDYSYGGDFEHAREVLARAEDVLDQLQEEHDGDEVEGAEQSPQGGGTKWRKQTEFVTSSVQCGPTHIAPAARDEEYQPADSYIEIEGSDEGSGAVTVETHVAGEYAGADFTQGEQMNLTPKQAREFATALIEQADHAEPSEEDVE